MRERVAIVGDGREVTYGELARRARAERLPDGAVAIVAAPTVETIVRLCAAIARRRGVRLIDPRLPSESVSLDGIAADEIAVATSGTSGRAKGVRLSRGALTAASAAWWKRVGVDGDERWLLALPLAHVGGLNVVLRSLAAGRTIVVARDPSTGAIADAVERERVTLASLVPTQLARLLDGDWRPPKHLRALVVGGAALSPSLLERARGRGWPILTTYGLSEACGTVAVDGRPLDGIGVRVVDGEIEIGGATLMRGYLTNVRSISADGWLRTGDLGFLDGDGRLRVLGRRDDVIVTGGEKVNPAEVEEALADAPSIAEACVFAVADDEWGALVAAAVVGAADDDEVARAVNRLTPWQRPRRIARLAALPRNALGKVDRAATAALALPLLHALRRNPRLPG